MLGISLIDLPIKSDAAIDHDICILCDGSASSLKADGDHAFTMTCKSLVMTRIGVAMTGSAVQSTKLPILEVEDLLRDYCATLAAAPARRPRFDSRPVIVACFALFVAAPGCAAATVFFLRQDSVIPPLVTAAAAAPLIMKSDRLPHAAPPILSPATPDDAEPARITLAMDRDNAEPMAMRGSLDDRVVAEAAGLDPVPAAREAMAFAPAADGILANQTGAAPKPRIKRSVRRTAPVRVVAEVTTPPEPPEPTFFEKLFGSHVF